MKLAFIGAGSMSEALISGIVCSNLMDAECITVSNRGNLERLKALQTKYGINYTLNIGQMVKEADIVLLAMKPKDVKEASQQWKKEINKSKLVISVLAGVSMKSIQLLVGHEIPIARAMPNTSATIGKSATAITLNSIVTDKQKDFILKLFQTVGFATMVEESQLDAVTGLSGSGPAYLYYIVEAMGKAAVDSGLDIHIANKLIAQTLIGTAEMIQISSKTPAELRKEVTSPGGTTEAGIKVLNHYNVQTAFFKCIQEATVQSIKLGRALNEELKLTK